MAFFFPFSLFLFQFVISRHLGRGFLFCFVSFYNFLLSDTLFNNTVCLLMHFHLLFSFILVFIRVVRVVFSFHRLVHYRRLFYFLY